MGTPSGVLRVAVLFDFVDFVAIVLRWVIGAVDAFVSAVVIL